jgi:hypothetical protein
MVGHDRSNILKQNPTRAGWSSKINQPDGEALSDDFDGRVLNSDGVEIDLLYWVFKRLKQLRLLDRDAATGMRRIQHCIFGLMDLWDGPDFRPDRHFRAFDPAYRQACSRDSGYANSFLRAIGSDCSGLVNPAATSPTTLHPTSTTHDSPRNTGA